MTTALYRRYRPDTFQEVIGQEHVTAPLMAALRADRVTHAYLFSGPRGCGKTTSARILARCLNCEQFPTDTPCGECPSCRDLATGGPGSLDVVEIDAASHNGVDDARDLRERASFAPARDRFKIFILDEAHMVTPQGFNALLKLVEEPPPHVKFIFATTEPEKVIGTIRSRTHHYPFRLVPPDILEHYLAGLTEAEGVRVGPGVFPLVTRAGGGSVRDTLSVLDQLIGGASDGEISYETAVSLLGYTDATMLDQCIDAIAAADGAGVFRVVDRLVESGHDPRRFVEDLLQRLRDLLVIALAGAEAGPALGSLPADQFERMQLQARTLGSGALSRYADITAQALQQMVGATSPRLQLELLMARLVVANGQGAVSSPTPSSGVPASAAVPAASHSQVSPPISMGHVPESTADEAIQEVETAAASSSAPQPATGLAQTPREAALAQPVVEQNAAEAAAESVDIAANAPAPQSASSSAEAEMLRTRWPEVLDAVRRERMATWALLKQHAQPGSMVNGVFSLRFTSAGLIGTFTNGGHLDVVSRAIEQALGLRLELRGELAGEGLPAAGSAVSSAPVGGPVAQGAPTATAPVSSASPGARAAQAAPAPVPSSPSAREEPRPFEQAAAEPAPPVMGWGEVAQIGRKLRQAEAAPGPAIGSDARSEGLGGEASSPADGHANTFATPAGSASDPGQPAASFQPTASSQAAVSSESVAPAQSASFAAPAAAQRVDSAQAAAPIAKAGEGAVDTPEPLATVHRLHKLPAVPVSARRGESGSQAEQNTQPEHNAQTAQKTQPGQASQSTQARVAAPSQAIQDAPAPAASEVSVTFSDGVPIPDEPRDYDGPPEDEGFVPADNEALSAARAAARAAARGEAPPATAAVATTRLEDDIPSDDDEDADDAGMVGLDVIKLMLGAVVLEDRTINPEERYV